MNIIKGIIYACKEIRSLFYLLNIVMRIYFYNFHILTFFYSSFLILFSNITYMFFKYFLFLNFP